MGVFSGKKRTTITGIHQRLLDDDSFTHASKIAVAQWLWENSGKLGVDLDGVDLSDYLIEASLRSLPKRFDKLYRYAKNTDKYIYGVPKSHLTQDPQNQILTATVNYLNELHDTEISLYGFDIGDIDFYTEAWLILINEYGYDSQTNELTKLSKQYGYRCYLYDGYLGLSEHTLSEYEEVGFDNYSVPFNYGKYFEREQETLRVQTEHIKEANDCLIITFGFERYDLPSPNPDILNESEYVEYITSLETHTLKIDLSHLNPVQEEGDDIKPENDWIYATYQIGEVFYWFKYEYGSGGIISIDNSLKATEAFGEYYPRLYVRLDKIDMIDRPNGHILKKHTQKIFKKLDLKLSDITKQLKQSVGNEYDNVRGMYLFMGVRVNDARYHSELAEYCYNYFKKLFELSNQQEEEYVIKSVGGIQVIQDIASSQVLKYNQMEYKEVSGKVTDVGKYLLQVDSLTSSSKRGWFRKRRYKTTYVHKFLYQVTQDTYYSLSVYDLSQDSFISGYNFTKKGLDSELVIPIDRTLIHHLTFKEREVLFHKSFHVAMIHVKVTKGKWYQRGAFKVVLAVIGIAISVLSSGTLSGFTAMIKTATINAIKAVAISYAVDMATKVAIELGLNPKIAGILSFVIHLTNISVAMGMDFSRVLTAPNIMSVMNKSFNTYNKMLALEYQDTLKQMKVLEDLSKQRENTLKEKQKLLNTKVFNPSQELLKSNYTPNINLFESVEMFYDRHYGYDVVKASHGLIDNFVSYSLDNKQPYIPPQEDVEDILII